MKNNNIGKDSPLKVSIETCNILENLNRLQRLQRLQSLESLESLCKSYEEIEIKPNSIIYCDIPYKGTDEYEGGFNHAEFYEWAQKQKELVIISEYSMPKDFVCVAETEKTVTLCSGGDKKAIEKLFIPEHQKELWESVKPKVYRQLAFSF